MGGLQVGVVSKLGRAAQRAGFFSTFRLTSYSGRRAAGAGAKDLPLSAPESLVSSFWRSGQFDRRL